MKKKEKAYLRILYILAGFTALSIVFLCAFIYEIKHYVWHS